MRYTIRQELFDDKVCDHMDLGLLHRVIPPAVVEQVLTDLQAKELLQCAQAVLTSP